jgi:hypothetical protein
VAVASDLAAICRLSFKVLTVSNIGCTLSCRSLLYVDGIPLMLIIRPAIAPNILPDLPRRSSRESLFFFWGIKELPVVYASASFT